MNLITSQIFKQSRRQKKLNQAQMAKALGTTQATISRIESRVLAPGSELLKRICEFMKKDLDELVREATTKSAMSG